MKKRLGIIRKIKKKHIFLALLAVIVLGGLAKAYSTWVGTTRIAFLNYQAIALGQISHANDNAMIKLSEITTDDFDHLDDLSRPPCSRGWPSGPVPSTGKRCP